MADPPELSLDTTTQHPIPDAATSPTTASDKEPSKSLSSPKPAAVDIDKLVAHFQRVIQTREGLDITLLFATEAARLIGAILDLLSRVNLRKYARALLILTSRLPKPISTALHSVPSIPLAAIASGASTRLQALVIVFEEWQILSRLWGLFDIWMSAKELVADSTEENEGGQKTSKIDTLVTIMQRVTLTSYHFCEATAWLSSQNVLKWSPDAQDKLLGWSAKSWGAFSCVEAVRLILERLRKRRGEQDSEDAEWRSQWWKELSQNLAWLPLAMHWNKLPEGLLPEILVALFGIYPSMGYMRDLWQATA